jgi:hypothetical protein
MRNVARTMFAVLFTGALLSSGLGDIAKNADAPRYVILAQSTPAPTPPPPNPSPQTATPIQPSEVEEEQRDQQQQQQQQTPPPNA